MRWNSFVGTIAFAVAAAALLPAAWLTLGPVFGGSWAVGGYLVLVSVVYVAGLARDLRQRYRVAGVAAALGAAVWVLAGSPLELALAAALILSLCRGWMFRGLPLRAAVIEMLLTGLGLGLANAVLGSGPLSAALALWAYLLMQSGFFLIGGVRDPEVERGDGYERARTRLLRLLEDEPV